MTYREIIKEIRDLTKGGVCNSIEQKRLNELKEMAVTIEKNVPVTTSYTTSYNKQIT